MQMLKDNNTSVRLKQERQTLTQNADHGTVGNSIIRDWAECIEIGPNDLLQHWMAMEESIIKENFQRK